ncbi:hypothetical protein NDA11_005601 [Ustilago hordei]|uniref:Ysc84 actin-binding domain-containing protein n=1 Tax=Ustilago hordei TaxID=120017 RepID=I2G1K8_USTHO|nr:uncharacterized protein UHO2_02479 [Ustilago hordei]KAJ1040145.1 hypothetical protein NDA10_003490 [Ustilago hordei]KAJ1585311.1 hypothetical protein NDA15_005050 [Ustilago hordei]KAJ1588260.1 hypothetical protein NDA12_005507 [Ustilago hordei]KAJ1593170.1 hypothetical protein NDA11_005601 [Ustilago hordei]UTT93849.1 hypothetical protein NDA17_006517 [Ustilago hordei]
MSNNPSSSTDESRWKRWGKTAFDKSIVVSDWASGYANSASAKLGGERFWPKSNDFPEEIAKCERILRAFTVEGVETKPSPTPKDGEAEDDKVVAKEKGKESFIKKKRKVLRKIPPQVIKRAKGIVIYTAMRSGIAPFGGAGGAGLMLARLPDGSWSAPSTISPNNLAVGLLLGFDIFDVILVVNTERAMETFKSHKVTLGAETAVAAGPFGTGISAEMGIDRSPVFSYVRSRGLYGGVEAMAQAFLHRFDENERIYYWPGITARDILEGKVRKPSLVDPLYRALRDAETGVAQGDSLERTVYENIHAPPNVAVRQLQLEESAELLQDGERLKLPPTPEELEALEEAGIPDDLDLALEKKEKEEAKRREEEERAAVRALPPPPRHKKVAGYWENRGTTPGGKRRVAPSPLHFQSAEQKTAPEDEGKMESIDLYDPEPPKPALPLRRLHGVDSLADELNRSTLDQVSREQGVDLPAYEAGEASIPLHSEIKTQAATIDASSEPVALIASSPTSSVAPVSAVPTDLTNDSELLSRSSSLTRPSRPPRRAAATRSTPATPTTAATDIISSGASAPKLRLFFDWDETITSSDTLSLIAPPDSTQLHGPSFDHYTEAYMSDLSTYFSSHSEPDSWSAQLEFLAGIDEVEVASVGRVEEGGLFKDMPKTELLQRAEKVQFRDGWDTFYSWLAEQSREGTIGAADVISVGWSADFIRQAITNPADGNDAGISKVYANEIDMDEDGKGTGKLTKSLPLSLLNLAGGSRGGIRTGIHKLEIMQALAKEEEVVKVYVGDSTTDLPCLVNADFGLVMKNKDGFEESSIGKTIARAKPPIKKLYKDHTDFLQAGEKEEGGVLIRVEDWTQALDVIQKIQELSFSQERNRKSIAR